MRQAVILAGGLGERLKPFTEVIPKPLLPIGEKALLEVQIERLRKGGINEIFIAAGYKSDYLKRFIGNGDRYGIEIHFSYEDKPLGTAGPLSLIRDKLNGHFLIINGDILTKADFRDIISVGESLGSKLTVVTKKIMTPFRFGNVIYKGNYILNIEEKPIFEHDILAGIYVMNEAIFEYIPKNVYFGIDDLIRKLLKLGEKIGRYHLKDYWVDIGQVDDYEKASREFIDEFNQE